jgi:hypothetical protein
LQTPVRDHRSRAFYTPTYHCKQLDSLYSCTLESTRKLRTLIICNLSIPPYRGGPRRAF